MIKKIEYDGRRIFLELDNGEVQHGHAQLIEYRQSSGMNQFSPCNMDIEMKFRCESLRSDQRCQIKTLSQYTPANMCDIGFDIVLKCGEIIDARRFAASIQRSAVNVNQNYSKTYVDQTVFDAKEEFSLWLEDVLTKELERGRK